MEREGCVVYTAHTEQEFRTEFLQYEPDVFILCQTLSAEECERAGRFAEEHSPKSRCVLLFTHYGDWVIEREHVLLNSNDGPRVLVDTMRRVLDNGPAPPNA